MRYVILHLHHRSRPFLQINLQERPRKNRTPPASRLYTASPTTFFTWYCLVSNPSTQSSPVTSPTLKVFMFIVTWRVRQMPLESDMLQKSQPLNRSWKADPNTERIWSMYVTAFRAASLLQGPTPSLKIVLPRFRGRTRLVRNRRACRLEALSARRASALFTTLVPRQPMCSHSYSSACFPNTQGTSPVWLLGETYHIDNQLISTRSTDKYL